MSKIVHVAVAVICTADDRIVITRRAEDAHQGGFWEFPGGKVENGESVQQALSRELLEELNIVPTNVRPFIQVKHNYGDKKVLLDTWWVDGFDGDLMAMENQPLAQVEIIELEDYCFPVANKPIVSAVMSMII